jgi:hypothetical protein
MTQAPFQAQNRQIRERPKSPQLRRILGTSHDARKDRLVTERRMGSNQHLRGFEDHVGTRDNDTRRSEEPGGPDTPILDCQLRGDRFHPHHEPR